MDESTRQDGVLPDGTAPADGAGDGADSRTASRRGISRKSVLRAALVAAPAALLGTAAVGPALARDKAQAGQRLTPTPYCDDGDDPTPPQMEGPYFSPGSPERTSLRIPGAPGTALVVSGYVFGLSCQPLSGVLLDFWQADNSGAYDNVGYRYRGHQYTGKDGSFRLETIVPGLYPGRTRHVHVKAQAPGKPILTTQLYFPGEPRNSTDPIFDPALLMNVRDAAPGKEATFDFVLNVEGGGSPTDPPTGTTWAADHTYAAGDRVTYSGVTYVCLQAHRSTAGWEPPNVPALWQRG